MSGATLAACQKSATAPVRVGLAVHVVCEVGSALHALHAQPDPATGRPFVHGNVSPESIVVRYDGGVELLPATAGARAEALRSRPGHLAPEQVSAGDVDRRADVFALGVVLWELLTSQRLFERENASSTRIAVIDEPIADVCTLNRDVPAALGQVLGAALERDRANRFDTVDAFCKALAGARASSGAAGATTADVARWVAERVPRTAPAPGSGSSPSLPSAVPDLDIPGASRAHRSRPSMEAVKAPSAPAIPAFDTSAMAAAALAPSTRPPAPPPPAASGRPSAPSSPASLSPGRPSSPSGPGGGREIAFDAGDDDDFDMQIERNLASTSIPVASSAHGAGATARSSRTSGAHGAAGTGLELAQPSRMAREQAARGHEDAGPGAGTRLAAALVTLLVAGGTTFGLIHQVHRAGGRDVTRLLPHAFDGTSATESGAVSLVSLVVAVILIFVGLRLKPHVWAIVAGGGALLLLALAMVTVTLASTGENAAPPDGVLLVPYLFPAAAVLFALGVYARSARVFARARGAGRVGAVPLAAIAGVLAFVAFETSRLAR